MQLIVKRFFDKSKPKLSENTIFQIRGCFKTSSMKYRGNRTHWDEHNYMYAHKSSDEMQKEFLSLVKDVFISQILSKDCSYFMNENYNTRNFNIQQNCLFWDF